MPDTLPNRRSLRELAEELALAEVQSYFDSPGQLENLASVREDYERRIVAVETQLEAGVQAQLDEMQNTVMLLNMAREEMTNVRSNFNKINRRTQAVTKAVHDFEHISRIRNARTNVREILQQLEIYDAVPRRVNELREKLEAEPRSLKAVFMEWLQLNAWRERILTDVSDQVTEASRKEQDLNARVANWEELDTINIHSNYSQSSHAYAQVLQVLGDHFRRVEELGQKIWDLVATRLANFFNLAQFGEAPSLIAAVEIVERIDLYNDRERARRSARGEAMEKLEMLIPPGQRRKQALGVLESAIEQRLSKALPDHLLPESVSSDPNPKLDTKGNTTVDSDDEDEEVDDEDDEDDEDDDEEDDDEDTDEEGGNVEHSPKPKGIPSKIPEFLRAGRDLILDLNSVAEDIAKCFPDSYSIVGLYRWVVERRMLRLLHPVFSSTRVSPGEKLQLVGFIDHYLSVVETLDLSHLDPDMDAASSVPPRGFAGFSGATTSTTTGSFTHSQSHRTITIGDASSNLHDDHRAAAMARAKELRREAEGMMSTYIADAFPRMEQMMHAITKQNRDPRIGRGGALQTATPEDLFNILAQELNVLRLHGVTGPHLASFVQRTVLEILRTYQGEQTNRLSSQDTSVEHCCAMMNDFERMYDLCDKVLILEVKQGMDMSDRGADALLSEIQSELDKVAGGFIRAIDAVAVRSVELIFAELESSEIVQSLFTSRWETNEARTMDRFVATFLDYFEDSSEGFRIWLGSELLFGRIVATCLAKTVDSYIMRLMSLRTSFSNKKYAIERMRADAQILQNFFGQYLDVLRYGKIRTQESLETKIDVIWHCARLMEAEEEDYPPKHFADVAQHFGPFAKQAIARLLFLRGDLSNDVRTTFLSEVSDYVESNPVAPRFDLSSLPPTPELLLEAASRQVTVAQAPVPLQKGSKSKSNKALVTKRRSKKKVKGKKSKTSSLSGEAGSSSPAVEMSLDSFVSSRMS